ncbi:putative Lon protease like peroxisomal [Rosellinia necatrix]|uniref:Putative Lon protease like peroxisomal n=1 Tax=Rosellinia necatrix TaxID=77044 RepID=A0A1S8A5V7_ROSNE|nr:putative Lon protease like peroxisomal [Rosellinia necatrix]
MSDPLSLALAIAPFALEALKRFRALNSKLRTFSHYSQEIKRVQTRFEVQQDFFQSECELLLRKVTTSQSQVEAFLTARQFDAGCRDTLKRLCAYLGSRQTAFQGTFEDIKASLHDLEAELQSFEQFDSKRQDGESLKDAVKRLGRRLKVTVNKTSYDEALERLKESNYDLKGIRKHAQELRDNSCMEQAGGNTRALPLECRQFSRVRLAALAFHEAMVTRWVCEERKHQRHLIRLFINAEVQRDVRMKFFLLGEWKLSGVVGLKRPDLICSEVRSAPIECSTDNREKRTQSSEETIDSRVTKRRRVRWAEEISDSADASRTELT